MSNKRNSGRGSEWLARAGGHEDVALASEGGALKQHSCPPKATVVPFGTPATGTALDLT